MNPVRHWSRWKTPVILVGTAVALALPAAARSGEALVHLTVNTASPSHVVNPEVYGHFFEHIYHSANGGLWGELVWNRSFELSHSGIGDWSSANGEIIQSSLITDVNFVFGDRSWEDYELTLQALKERGAEGFLVLFRARDEDSFYWLNLGGWGNTRHAVEKEIEGGRRGIGRGHNGVIETGRWYDVRIRCEGNQLQAWLDEEQIIDLRDEDNPHLKGMIGLGTWGTHARYRNLKVKKLVGGEELFSGLPTLPGKPFEVDFWTHFGPGKAEKVTDALNNQYSVSLTSDGAPTGIEQANFRFVPQRYAGSIWMKGSLPAGIKLELLDQDNVLGQTVLGPPRAGWAEYPFEITPRGSTLDGSLRITLLGEGSVKLDQVSLMGADALAVGGFRPDLLDAVRGTRISTRWARMSICGCATRSAPNRCWSSTPGCWMPGVVRRLSFGSPPVTITCPTLWTGWNTAMATHRLPWAHCARLTDTPNRTALFIGKSTTRPGLPASMPISRR